MKRAGIGDRMGDGLRVRIRGKVSVYERTGQSSSQMTSIDPKHTIGLLAVERDRVLQALVRGGPPRRPTAACRAPSARRCGSRC